MNESNESMSRGVLGVGFFGRYNPSSIGNSCNIESRTGGKIVYIGVNGEETTRYFYWRASPVPAEVDGGVNGGVKFDAPWSQFAETGGKMARLVISRSFGR